MDLEYFGQQIDDLIVDLEIIDEFEIEDLSTSDDAFFDDIDNDDDNY